jgi:hydroxymethylglutaryl-CoA lyase
MKTKIKITEVGPRDGLQNETNIISTEDKKHFILLLEKSGLSHIEITSFVRPDRIPQLADNTQLSSLLDPILKEKSSVLVPNLKGYESAIKSGYKEIAIFTASSETFTKKNINMTIHESIEIYREISKRAKQDGVKIRAYISTVLHCPYEGYIPPQKVLSTIEALDFLEPHEISLGDTIGLGVPFELEKLLELVLRKYPPSYFAGHFHDTYGFALSNIQKSLDMGIRSFDSSAGGLGGCPYARGASGNLATEDLIFYLEKSGYETGVSLDSIFKASMFIKDKVFKDLPSKTFQAFFSKTKES